MEFQLADLSAKNYKINSADSLYKKLIQQNPNRTLFYLSKLRNEISKRDTLLSLYLNGDPLNKYLILKNLNEERYLYNSFPALVDLSRSLNENYNIFISQFKKTLIVNDYQSGYGVYKLSSFMLENLDYIKARKMAALSLRFSGDISFTKLQNENYKKCSWMYFNAEKFLSEFKFN